MNLNTKFIRIRTNSREFFARKIGYVTNGLYCILSILYMNIAVAMLVGKKMSTSPFPQIICQKIPQLLRPMTFFLMVQVTSNLVQKHFMWSLR